MTNKDLVEGKKRKKRKEKFGKYLVRKLKERKAKRMKKRRDHFEEKFTPEIRAYYQHEHFDKRVRERLHAEEFKEDPMLLKYILDAVINSGTAPLVGESFGSFLYDVDIGGVVYRVVFDPVSGAFKSIWPVEVRA